MAEVCRRFEISRITGYKWLSRFETEGLSGLKDRSHAPHSNPRQVVEEVEDAIVEARGQHAHWGPVKLRSWLEKRAPEVKWPAPSTIGEILRRHGLAVAHTHKKRGKATPNQEPLKHAQGPNLVWCADFKGWFRCLDGSRCDPLTITDDRRCVGSRTPPSRSAALARSLDLDRVAPPFDNEPFARGARCRCASQFRRRPSLSATSEGSGRAGDPDRRGSWVRRLLPVAPSCEAGPHRKAANGTSRVHAGFGSTPVVNPWQPPDPARPPSSFLRPPYGMSGNVEPELTVRDTALRSIAVVQRLTAMLSGRAV